MNHNSHPANRTTQTRTRAEAERLLGLSEKLLASRDLTGSREFALLALETDSLLEGSEQILAIIDVLLASQKRVNNNRQPDYYSILQTDRRSEPDLLRKNYRRLALLLHPDKNNYPLANEAFNLVSDAWNVLSDLSKKTPYDHELSLYTKVDLRQQQQQQTVDVNSHKLPARRSARGGAFGGGADTVNESAPPPHSSSRAMNKGVHRDVGGGGGGVSSGSFWTACPYCYVLYEYENEYEEFCVRCHNCDRAFQATLLPSLPPMVPGKEAYYCCWGFYPLGFELESTGNKAKNVDTNNNNTANNVAAATTNNNNNNNNRVDGAAAAAASTTSNIPNMSFPSWMPGMFNSPGGAGAPAQQQHVGVNVNMNNVPNAIDFSGGSGAAGFGNAMPGMSTPGAKKRGRPRKNPLGA